MPQEQNVELFPIQELPGQILAYYKKVGDIIIVAAMFVKSEHHKTLLIHVEDNRAVFCDKWTKPIDDPAEGRLPERHWVKANYTQCYFTF